MELSVRATSRSSQTQNAGYLFINKDVQSECLSNSVDETGQTRSEIWQHVQRQRFGGQTARGKGVRSGNKKSKTGCMTCRVRRIKCDETTPHCRRCTSTGRKCEGPIMQKIRPVPDTSFERRRNYNGVLALTVLSPQYSGEQEQRAFDFFSHRAAPVLSGAFDSEFWSYFILQVSHSEPVVWDAVIAISSLLEHLQSSTSSSVEPGDEPLEADSAHQQALKWYNRSISRLREQIEKDTVGESVVLLSCLLFICLELLQNNITQALSLFANGTKMLRNIAQRTSPSATQYGLGNRRRSRLIRDNISLMFSRLGAIAATRSCMNPYRIFRSSKPIVSEANSEYPTGTLEDGPEQDGPEQAGPEQARPADLFNFDTTLESPFDGLSDARNALTTLADSCYTVIRLTESCKHQVSSQVAALTSRRHNLESKLRAWHSAFSEFNNSSRHAASPKYVWVSSIILVYYHITLIFLSTCSSPYETSFDEHIHAFELMLNHATSALAYGVGSDRSQPQFTFEMGLVPPLYFVALKCRQPVVRRRAISLLKEATQKERIWNALPVARIAERIQQLEEEGLVQHEVPDASFSSMTLPAESKRVHDIEVLQEIPVDGTQPIRFRVTRYYHDANGVRQSAVDILSTARC